MNEEQFKATQAIQNAITQLNDALLCGVKLGVKATLEVGKRKPYQSVGDSPNELSVSYEFEDLLKGALPSKIFEE